MPKFIFYFVFIIEVMYFFTPYKIVDPALSPYVSHIEKLVNNYCTKDQYYNPGQIEIKFEILGKRIIGYCQRKAINKYVIYVDPIYWDRAEFDERYSLIAHEMTHCMFNEEHNKDIKNYMYFAENHLASAIVREQMKVLLINKCSKH